MMNAQDWRLALTLCRRELRGGLRGFGVFLGCLFLGVLAISAVGSLGRALEAGLARDAKAILGADVSVSLTSRDLSADEAPICAVWATLSRTLGTRTMARAVRPADASSGPCWSSSKAWTVLYPLYGRLELEGGGRCRNCLAP
jgi:putative ABC transport system permease protein